MPDYKKGKIYELVCRITGEKYVGSTIDSLSRRLVKHRSLKQNETCSRQIIERGDYYINLLEDCPCENKEQLRKKEREWYDKIEGGCINRQRPYITKEEHIQRNSDYSKKYREENNYKVNALTKKWKDENKEKVAEYQKKYWEKEITCECGVISKWGNIQKHLRTDKHKLLLANKNIPVL